ncbi:head-tail adaptor protein [Methylobacterium sp. E-045]|uniref:phage head completion protein n=1 Tax=Methylobacterium sp. E-045 TaxID=2836575 RepID=UPI001FB9692F|nr:head-tail adaptor protein [Methylobacterium sp. E-045]MCJ2132455.1 head-tail adaptor protein [Methylobacterium sp. E-045]
MDPARLDIRATFRRRPVVGTVSRGPYADAFTVWANYRRATNREIAEGGQAVDVEAGVLMVRDSTQARTITNADRVVIEGRDFAIEGVAVRNRTSGLITLTLSSRKGGQ